MRGDGASGHSKPIADQINKWFDQVVAAGKETRRFPASFGGDQLTMTPDHPEALFLKEIDSWGGACPHCQDRAVR